MTTEGLALTPFFAQISSLAREKLTRQTIFFIVQYSSSFSTTTPFGAKRISAMAVAIVSAAASCEAPSLIGAVLRLLGMRRQLTEVPPLTAIVITGEQ